MLAMDMMRRLCCTRLYVMIMVWSWLAVAFAAEAGDFFHQPTMLTYDQELQVDKPASDQFYAIDLVQGQDYTFLLQTRQTSGSVRAQMYAPNNNSLVLLDFGSLTNNSFYSHDYTAPVTGRYTLKMSGVAAAIKLVAMRGFSAPGVTDASRPYYVTDNTARYLQEGDYQHTGKTEMFRFEAKVGDRIDLFFRTTDNFGSSSFRLFAPSKPNYRSMRELRLQNTATDSMSFVAQMPGVYLLEVIGTVGRRYQMSSSGVRVNADDDEDGLSNTAELWRELSPSVADTNGDGISDLVAAQAGRRGLHLVEWKAADMASAISFQSAKAIQYTDNTFSFPLDGAEKFISLDVKKGDAITIESRLWFDVPSLDLTLFSPDQNVIHSTSQPNRGGRHVIEFVAQVTGRYVVKLDAGNGLAEFAIHRGFNQLAANDQNAPFHGSFNTAHYLTEGNHVFTGYASYYRFEVRQGDAVSLQLQTRRNAGSMKFELFPPNQTKAFKGTPSLIDNESATLSFTGVEAGVYILKVSGDAGRWSLTAAGLRPEADEDADGLTNTQEMSRGLNVQQADSNQNGFTDAEDLLAGRDARFSFAWLRADLAQATSTATAKVLPTFAKPWSIDFAGDKRYIRLPLIAGQPMAIQVQNNTNRGFITASVLQPVSNTRIRTSSSLGDGESQQLSFIAETSGAYHLEISGDPSEVILNVQYGFASALLTPMATSDRQSFVTSTYLTTGNYDKRDGIDYFHFVLNAGEIADINLSAELLSGSLGMAIMTGAVGKEGLVLASNRISHGESGNITVKAAQAGLYYLRVDGPRGRYRLQIQGVQPNLDSDNDGLSNAAEWFRGTEWFQADTNGNQTPDLVDGQLGRLGRYAVEWKPEDLAAAISPLKAIAFPYRDRPLSLHLNGSVRYLKLDLAQGEHIAVSARTLLNTGSQYIKVFAPNNTGSSANFSMTSIDSQIHKNGDFIAPVAGTYSFEIGGAQGVMDVAVYRGHRNAGVHDEQRNFYQTPATAKVLMPGKHWVDAGGNALRFVGTTGKNVSITLSVATNRTPFSFKVVSAADLNTDIVEAWTIRDGETVTRSFTPTHDGVYYLLVNAVQGSYSLLTTGIDSPHYQVTNSTLPLNAGSVLCVPDVVVYAGATACQAIAQNGFKFSHWSGDCQGSVCVMANIRRDRRVVANFAATYRVHAVANASGGQIEVSEFNEIAGSQITFRVQANPGYRIGRQVYGTCPIGQWLDDHSYQTGAITEQCHVQFVFQSSQPQRGLPWWVLMSANATTPSKN